MNVSNVEVDATAIEGVSLLREYQALKIFSLAVRPKWTSLFKQTAWTAWTVA